MKKCALFACIAICLFGLCHFRYENLDIVNELLTIQNAYFFAENTRMLEVPSYNLAEDFPREHVKTFHDFLAFWESLKRPRFHREYAPQYRRSPVVKARLELNDPVRYEDFLSAVSMSFSSLGLEIFLFHFDIFPRNAFFADNILDPLSHDLKYGNYSGYHFKVENLPQFFRGFVEHRYDVLFGKARMLMGGDLFPLPREFRLAGMYAGTFWRIHKGKLRDAYKTIYDHFSYRRFPDEGLPYRPYHYLSDEERCLWFEFLQAELRSADHADFADSILETEFAHYRELIVWQLSLRAYFAQKLYEYGDNDNLSTLRDLLAAEHAELKNEPYLQPSFESADVILRGIDGKVRASSPADPAKGIIVLPWIDRDTIDRLQGFREDTAHTNYFSNRKPREITWKKDMESIDDETKREMKNSYEMSVRCIRALAVISERLYLERDLKTMSRLHAKLEGNFKISNIKSDFSSDSAVELLIRQNYKDPPELDSLTKLDLRRFELIKDDFWGHQVWRRNGDITVGDIVLPWVEADGN